MRLFKRNRKDHWERVYQKLSPEEVGWYQAYPDRSLQLINHTSIGPDGRIIDVGGGTSTLCLHLLDKGYRNLTVLDISGNSIEKSKTRLGEKSSEIKWIEMKKQLMPHARELRLKLNDNESWTLRLDQGFGYWRTTSFNEPYPFHQSPDRQVKYIQDANIDMCAGSNSYSTYWYLDLKTV